MTPKLNIENHIDKHEQCSKILEMIKINRRYMLSDMTPSEMYISLWGRNHLEQRVEFRKKIQNRLLSYYAKKVAEIGSEAYEVAMAIREPKQI